MFFHNISFGLRDSITNYVLKQEVKLEFKGHRGHEKGGETVGGRVVKEGEADSCLVSQPEVAGEREVGEEVQETRGIQEDDRVVRVEGGERWLETERGEEVCQVEGGEIWLRRKRRKKVEKATYIQWNLRQGTLLKIFVECKVYTMARI